jgi:hypothetical protein
MCRRKKHPLGYHVPKKQAIFPLSSQEGVSQIFLAFETVARRSEKLQKYRASTLVWNNHTCKQFITMNSIGQIISKLEDFNGNAFASFPHQEKAA